MKIRVLSGQEPSVIFQVLTILEDRGYTVIDHHLERVDILGQSIRIFAILDDGNFDGLTEEIMSLPSVTGVNVVERNLAAEALEKDLQKKASYLISLYPNFVTELRMIDVDPEIDDSEKFRIGQYMGQGLIETGKINLKQSSNIKRVIKRIVIPALRSFSIVKFQGLEVQLFANPLCLDKSREYPCCHILAGMIQYLIQIGTGLTEYSVEETSCKASGDTSCTFSITTTSI